MRSRMYVVLLAVGILGACSANAPVGVHDDADAGATLDGSPGGDGDGDGDSDAGMPAIPGLQSLRIEPANATIADDGASPGEKATFKALGKFKDGERDITDQVTWTLDNQALGALDQGAFTSAGIGGQALVTATSGKTTSNADLTVKLNATFSDPEAPAGVAEMFPADTTGDLTGNASTLSIVYPSNETMFPKNLERVLHQWVNSSALDTFEVRFQSTVADVRFYTSKSDFLPTLEQWKWLADSHAGSSLIMSVRGLASADPSAIHRSQDVRLYYSRTPVLGALYYWSTGAAGVMKAHISAAVASKFFPDPDAEDAGTCASCHTVSRDGRRLAVNYGGERLRQVSVPERDVQIPADPKEAGVDYGWGTYNPGATRLLYASKGKLSLLDAETGDALGAVDLGANKWATHPDWSPDGKFVAIAYSTGKAPGNKDVTGASLARIPVNADGSFGKVEVLLQSAAVDDTLYFPSHSPDSKYIAFVRGKGKSKDNVSSQLFLMRADGSGEPIALTRLNQRVRAEDGVIGIGNSMPTWAPTTDAKEVFWLAFSSVRDYGGVLVGTARDQLWGAAIDVTAVERNEDPSYAAFWMPFQQLDEGNHRAFWAIDTEEECPTDVEICDGIDNDCDAIVDEDCCTPKAEVCGNDTDEDCDGTADDSCGCEATETCDNNQDDDCDGLTDDDDEDCDVVVL